ncbi:MAG: hypothetical protein GY913_18700 [Proteobacteria bacterium]|nr:hypothetical protein [Pseudomonadota bacterium]MCP4918940.1 hypothetical protein [Pseudomonadota bacterium]
MLVVIALLGCKPADRTVQALVDARAEQIGLDARLATRLALASGGLVAQYTPVTAETWAGADRIEVEPDLAAVMGILDPGLVVSDVDTGSHHVTWPSVEFSPSIHGRIEFEVLRPQTTFRVAFLQNPGEEPGVYASSTVQVVEGALQSPVLEVEHELHIGDSEQKVVLPAPRVVGDTGGAPRASWPAGGSYLPEEGSFLWSRTYRDKLQELESLGVEEIDGEAWSAVARSEDWEHVLELDLSREGQ